VAGRLAQLLADWRRCWLAQVLAGWLAGCGLPRPWAVPPGSCSRHPGCLQCHPSPRLTCPLLLSRSAAALRAQEHVRRLR
jgi:hypothetical protein